MSKTNILRDLLRSGTFLHLPSVYDPITARLVEAAGFEAAYVGGYVSGASRAIAEPLLTMSEQVAIAGAVAHSVGIPVLADAGAGFGEPLHTMRTVREFSRAGIAGIHIEDQLFPKRAHYHMYQVHTIPSEEFVAKIRYACRARDEIDEKFLIIARSDTCREFGVQEASGRINRAGDAGGRGPGHDPRWHRQIRIPPGEKISSFHCQHHRHTQRTPGRRGNKLPAGGQRNGYQMVRGANS